MFKFGTPSTKTNASVVAFSEAKRGRNTQRMSHVQQRSRAKFRADKLRPLAQQSDRATLRLGRCEQPFLSHAALMPQAVQLPGIDAVAGGFKALLQNTRQSEVHVVAAQQYVVANSHAFQCQFAVLFRNRDEAGIRGAAANVAHENQVADLDSAAPITQSLPAGHP